MQRSFRGIRSVAGATTVGSSGSFMVHATVRPPTVTPPAQRHERRLGRGVKESVQRRGPPRLLVGDGRSNKAGSPHEADQQSSQSARKDGTAGVRGEGSARHALSAAPLQESESEGRALDYSPPPSTSPLASSMNA